MSNWRETANEQSKYGNTVPKNEGQLNFTPRKNYVLPKAEDKGKNNLPEYGHMTFLKKLNQDNQEVILITSLGYVVRGFVKAIDEQTLSLKCPNKGKEGVEEAQGYRTRILFKSNIIEISPVRGIENLADELEQKGWVNPMTFEGFEIDNDEIVTC